MNALLEAESLQNRTKPAEKQILFVCTGNTCRSPMAAAVYNALYAGDHSHAFSAGLAADGSGISRNAALALLHSGIPADGNNDYLAHVSHTVTEADLEKADLVIGITGRHAARLLFTAPAYASKITALPMDIEDPYGGDEAVYEACLAQIREALAQMFVLAEPEQEA